MPELSIIIPALNEEKYLPKLLKSIKKQSYKDYEIIVADAGSKDKTRKIAKKHGCKVIKGGTPAVGRNAGAKIAKGKILLFLDADVILLPRDFLKNCLSEFKKRNLDAATSCYLPISKRLADKCIAFIAKFWVLSMQIISPSAGGFFILVKRDIHKKIKGFNQKILLAEDFNYVKRISKIFKFGILKERILLSQRRYDKEGRFKLMLKYIIIIFYRLFFGEIKKRRFEYSFGDY